jgi:hypothetical protein
MKAVFILLLFPVLLVNAQTRFDAKINEAAKQLTCAIPDERNPVTLNAKLIFDGDSIAVIVKTSIAHGWHIYQYVPATLPYIPIDHILEFPLNLKKSGGWIRSRPMSSVNDPGVLIYEQSAIFIHKLVKVPSTQEDGVIRTGLYYQTCNLKQCLPPAEKIFELKY